MELMLPTESTEFIEANENAAFSDPKEPIALIAKTAKKPFMAKKENAATKL